MIVCCWTSAFRSRAYLNPWCTSNLFAGVGSSFSTLNSNIDRVPYKPSHYFCLLDRASYSSGEWTEFLQLSWAHANTYASSDKMSQLSYVQLASQQTTINVGHAFSHEPDSDGFVCIFVKPAAGHRFVGHDRDSDAQHELATPVAFVVVQLYDHALTLGQEVNLASFMSFVTI